MFEVKRVRGVLNSRDGNSHQWKRRVAYGVSWVYVACMVMMCSMWM